MGEEAWEREEGPAQTGDVTVTAAPLAELTPDVDAYYEPRLGFGIPLIPSGQDSSGVPTNFSTSIAEYKNYLAYEMRALPDSSLRWAYAPMKSQLLITRARCILPFLKWGASRTRSWRASMLREGCRREICGTIRSAETVSCLPGALTRNGLKAMRWRSSTD